MNLRFTKMHGLGNDFVVIDGIHQALTLGPEQYRFLADRHFGVGCDQILLVERPTQPGVDFRYRIFNADGGEVEQCGNGARCVAEWLRLAGRADGGTLAMDSPGGLVHARLEQPGRVSVDMGAPRFEPATLPFLPATPGVAPTADGLRHALELGGRRIEFAIASMGNPHAVIMVDDVAAAPVAEVGAALQRHPSFPQSVNVGFMQVVDDAHIKLRVYERGVGETLACGTGACAAVAVGRKAGRLAGDVEVALPGGRLRIRWPGAGEPLWMTGPADVAFRGQVEL